MVEIKLSDALAAGVINVFALKDDKSFIVVLCHSKGSYIIPIIKKRAYICLDDDDEAEVIRNFLIKITKSGVFPDLMNTEVFFKAAPAHTKTVVRAIGGDGIKQYAKINDVLVENGYTVDDGEPTITMATKDYSKLIESNPEAKALYEDNKRKLAIVDATFDELNIEAKTAYELIMASKDTKPVVFIGPPGTGKSWAARIIADHMKAPLIPKQISGGTTEDDLKGSFVPNTDPGSDAKWKFSIGPLMKAYAEGWPIVLEEINYGTPQVLDVLNSFADDTPVIEAPDGTLYKRHPNFVLFMTMNPGSAGSDPLIQALKNRLSVVRIDALSEDLFCNRMIQFTKSLGHAFSDEFFKQLFKFAQKIETLSKDHNYHEDLVLSVRNAQSFCYSILASHKTLEEFTAALEIAYINHLSLDSDNCERVANLVKDDSIKNDISKLYALYDYADMVKVDTLPDLASLYTVGDTGIAGDDESLTDDELSEELESGLDD